jgi:D-alanyl-D-alanine carboxypeptidase
MRTSIHMCRVALLTVAVIALIHLPVSAQEFATRADAYVEAYVRQGKFTGSVLVAKDGKPVFRKSYGFANREWEIPNTPDTKFRIGSITKQFTAMAVLQLMEASKVKLDDPVKKYYEAAPAAWDKITVHHLLTHTSGIPSYTALPNFFRDKARDPLKPAEIVKLTQDKPLEFEPGEKWAYNNTGYVLLGLIIEKVSGQTYADYVRTHIFEPLGMKDSGYDAASVVLKKRAAGYSPDGTNAPYLDMTLPHAAGALYSTVDDMLIWDQALYAGKLLSKESYEKMFTPVKNDYAFGWVVRTFGGRKEIGHGGGIHGFNTSFIRYPAEKVAVVVFSNTNGPSADRIGKDLGPLFFGEPVKPPKEKKAISLSSDALEAFVGVYELSATFKITITREGDSLFSQATNQPKLPIFPSSDSTFFLKVVDADLEFQRDGSGKVTGVTLKQGGRTTPGKRL